jgi:hypothetical protein
MNGRPLHGVEIERPHDLTDLPNITIVLGEALRRAEITSIAVLAELGAERAWDRLHAAGARPDAHILLALEGAITGTSWRELPRARRCELLQWMTQHLAESRASSAL